MAAFVATTGDEAWDYTALKQRFDQSGPLWAALDGDVCVSPATLASWYTAGFQGRPDRGQRVNTDDWPGFEYAASKVIRRVTANAFPAILQLWSGRPSATGHLYNVPAADSAGILRAAAARIHILRGGILNEQGQERQSFEEFQAALSIDPDNADAKYLLGISPLHERMARQRLAKNASDPTTYQELAYILCQNRRFGEAATLLEQAVASKPDPNLVFILARTYEEKGAIPEAIATYEKLLSLDPGNEMISRYIQELKNR
jgi:tetratricopeptide (TPR) repeat protein